jgi:hypothetical protein
MYLLPPLTTHVTKLVTSSTGLILFYNQSLAEQPLTAAAKNEKHKTHGRNLSSISRSTHTKLNFQPRFRNYQTATFLPTTMSDLGSQLNQLTPEQKQAVLARAQQEANQQVMQGP